MEINTTHQGTELKEVLELLQQYQERCRIIAGGTDIIIQLREGRINPDVLIDVSSINEMKGIKIVGDILEIGAVTTFTDLIKNPLLHRNLRGLLEGAESVGSPQIRNAATLGGNICNASPAADIVPSLLVLDSEVVIESQDHKRSILLEKFLIDKGRVDLRNNELLIKVQFKDIGESQGLGFAKLGFRKALAISKMTVAVLIEIEDKHFKDIRIATGACSKLGMREREMEDFMKGKSIDEESLQLGATFFKEHLEKRLQGRFGAEFKGEAIRGIFKEAVIKALKNASYPHNSIKGGRV